MAIEMRPEETSAPSGWREGWLPVASARVGPVAVARADPAVRVVDQMLDLAQESSEARVGANGHPGIPRCGGAARAPDHGCSEYPRLPRSACGGDTFQAAWIPRPPVIAPARTAIPGRASISPGPHFFASVRPHNPTYTADPRGRASEALREPRVAALRTRAHERTSRQGSRSRPLSSQARGPTGLRSRRCEARSHSTCATRACARIQ
jgi:hypothetical protein